MSANCSTNGNNVSNLLAYWALPKHTITIPVFKATAIATVKNKTKKQEQQQNTSIIAHTESVFHATRSKVFGIKITLLQDSQSVSFHIEILYLSVMSLLLSMSLFLYSFVFLCSLGSMYLILRRQLSGIGSLFPPCKIQWGNWDNHIFWQEPLLADVFHVTITFFFHISQQKQFDQCTVTKSAHCNFHCENILALTMDITVASHPRINIFSIYLSKTTLCGFSLSFI